jgi:aspartate/methionine/tyrosine aminotransferase
MIKPMGAFYSVPDISSFGMAAITFAKRLLDEAHVAVIPGTPFGAPNNIRLSYACSEADIRLAVKRIAKFSAKLDCECV